MPKSSNMLIFEVTLKLNQLIQNFMQYEAQKNNYTGSVML